jgi:O-antigen biosynthesis protein
MSMNYCISAQWPLKYRHFLNELLISNKSDILEFGCHSGLLSKILINKGKSVTGFDNDENAIQKAKERNVIAFCTDLNNIESWESIIENKKFDSILFLHILEHLYNPLEVLENSIKYLKTDGVILIALPNICNARNRFSIALKGKFEYTETGVMDNTHIRFFNFQTANNLIDKAGLKVIEYYAPVQVNPIREFIDQIPYICKIRNIFKYDGPMFLPFSANLTDVVMVFKCKLV